MSSFPVLTDAGDFAPFGAGPDAPSRMTIAVRGAAGVAPALAAPHVLESFRAGQGLGEGTRPGRSVGSGQCRVGAVFRSIPAGAATGCAA